MFARPDSEYTEVESNSWALLLAFEAVCPTLNGMNIVRRDVLLRDDWDPFEAAILYYGHGIRCM